MSRAHCLDCGTEVAVDPLGHCPAGHLLPAHGHMVDSAIGSDDNHPDEPEPWVGQVAPPAAEESDPAAPSAQPQAAPGMAPAEREADAGDLLRELGALGADDEPGPTTATSGAPGARPSTPPQPGPSATPDAAVSEHSALEQAIQSLDASHPTPPQAPHATPQTRTPAPATPPVAAPAPTDESLSSLFDELEGLGEHGSGTAAATPPPSAPPPPPPAPPAPPASSQAPSPRARRSAPADESPWDTLTDVATLASETAGPASDAGASDGRHETPAPTRSVDTMNFTAKGGDMNGRRRRRRFGR